MHLDGASRLCIDSYAIRIIIHQKLQQLTIKY